MGFAFNNEITYNVKKIGEQNGKRFNDRKCIKKYCIFFIAIFIVIFLTDIVRNGRFVLLATVKPIVGLTSTPEKAVSETVAYLTICFIGIPFITDYNIISSIFRGLGDSKSPMYFIAVACMANIVLDYIFIGGMNLGAAGAALGTTLSQTISVMVALSVILRRKTGITLKKPDFKPQSQTMGQILKIGIPVALQDGFI